MAERDGFVRRWARLKTEAREPRRREAARPSPPQPSSDLREALPAGANVPSDEGKSDAELLAAHDLPSIDSLTNGSDFAAFMKENVPTRLRNLALGKLWRSDPVFAELDGLIDYNDDLSVAIPLDGPVGSYRPGQGYVEEDDVATETETDASRKAVADPIERAEGMAEDPAPPATTTASADAPNDGYDPALGGTPADDDAGRKSEA